MNILIFNVIKKIAAPCGFVEYLQRVGNLSTPHNGEL